MNKTQLNQITDGEWPAVSFFIEDLETFKVVLYKAEGDFNTVRYLSAAQMHSLIQQLMEHATLTPGGTSVLVPSIRH